MEKIKNKSKDILEVITLLLVYLLEPQIIGNIIHSIFKLPGTTCVYIGDIFTLFIVFFSYKDMLIDKFKEYFSKVSNFSDSLKYWGIGLSIMLVSNLIINILILKNTGSTNESIVRDSLKIYPLIGFICIAVVAPFIEEMIFRFGLRKVTGKKYFPLISGLVFGFIHTIAGLENGNLVELIYIIPYGGLGYTFALSYNKTDNIFSSIMCHVIHNTLVYTIIMAFA